MRLSVLSTAVAERAGVLCCVLFMVISAQALAQTSAATDDKLAIVEQKPAPAEEKPAVAHEKPALKQKSVAKQSKSAVHSKGAEHSRPVQPATAAQKPRERTMVMVCTHFRTYNPSSGTYRGYDGQTHSCR